MKADLAIYINMLGVPGQYKSVALMLCFKLDFSCCANKNGFRRDSHILEAHQNQHGYIVKVNAIIAQLMLTYTIPLT